MYQLRLYAGDNMSFIIQISNYQFIILTFIISFIYMQWLQ